MFMLRRPSQDVIDRFIRESRDLPLSYGSIGISQAAPAGYDVDEIVVPIGRGRHDFERARAALESWTQFRLGWVEVFPAHAPVNAGAVVAVLVQHCGFWSLNGCRIVSVVHESREDLRAGFAYGTLTNHVEEGEERFEVFVDSRTDDVMYRLRAVSRPRAVLARAAYPVARWLQARFRRDSARAMNRVTADGFMS